MVIAIACLQSDLNWSRENPDIGQARSTARERLRSDQTTMTPNARDHLPATGGEAGC
jgi:hypothetical protein